MEVLPQFSDLEIAKWYVVLGLHGNMDMSFVVSMIERQSLTDKQSEAVNRCVGSLKMRTRVDKYELVGSHPFFADEIDFDDEDDGLCTITQTSLVGMPFILSEKKTYSIEAWKTTHTKQKQKDTSKPKKKLSDFTA